MTQGNFFVNQCVLIRIAETLKDCGKRFMRVSQVTPHGKYVTYLESVQAYTQKKPDDETQYLNDILPTDMKAEWHCERGKIVISFLNFREWQVKHYNDRIQKVKDAGAKSFLRQTLHGLKKDAPELDS